jgi:hypothetical protein
VSDAWLVVVLCGAATVAIKAAGPVLLGGRTPNLATANVIGLLGPALLAALVAVNTFGGARVLTLDARVLGVVAAAVAIWRRAPMLLVVIVAAGVTALARAVG